MQTQCMHLRNFATLPIFLTKSKEGKVEDFLWEQFFGLQCAVVHLMGTLSAYHLSKLHWNMYIFHSQKQRFGVVWCFV